MNKHQVLKGVVILQAVCMIVLTGMVIVKVWPIIGIRGDDAIDKLPPDSSIGQSDGDDSAPVGLESDDSIAAMVGGKFISHQRLTEELYERYGEEMLRTLMVRQAIDLEADSLGIHISPDEKEQELLSMIDGYDSEKQFFAIMQEQLGLTRQNVLEDMVYRLLLEKIMIHGIDVPDFEVSSYLAEHAEEFAAKLQLHLQWIITETLPQSEQLLKLLENGEDFAMLARQYSMDEFTAELGGDVGLIDSDDPFYDENVLKAASKLQVGDMAGPIALEEGYAIIRLTGRTLTGGVNEEKQREVARKRIALEQAKSMRATEEDLLHKYEAKRY